MGPLIEYALAAVTHGPGSTEGGGGLSHLKGALPEGTVTAAKRWDQNFLKDGGTAGVALTEAILLGARRSAPELAHEAVDRIPDLTPLLKRLSRLKYKGVDGPQSSRHGRPVYYSKFTSSKLRRLNVV